MKSSLKSSSARKPKLKDLLKNEKAVMWGVAGLLFFGAFMLAMHKRNAKPRVDDRVAMNWSDAQGGLEWQGGVEGSVDRAAETLGINDRITVKRNRAMKKRQRGRVKDAPKYRKGGGSVRQVDMPAPAGDEDGEEVTVGTRGGGSTGAFNAVKGFYDQNTGGGAGFGGGPSVGKSNQTSSAMIPTDKPPQTVDAGNRGQGVFRRLSNRVRSAFGKLSGAKNKGARTALFAGDGGAGPHATVGGASETTFGSEGGTVGQTGAASTGGGMDPNGEPVPTGGGGGTNPGGGGGGGGGGGDDDGGDDDGGGEEGGGKSGGVPTGAENPTKDPEGCAGGTSETETSNPNQPNYCVPDQSEVNMDECYKQVPYLEDPKLTRCVVFRCGKGKLDQIKEDGLAVFEKGKEAVWSTMYQGLLKPELADTVEAQDRIREAASERKDSEPYQCQDCEGVRTCLATMMTETTRIGELAMAYPDGEMGKFADAGVDLNHEDGIEKSEQWETHGIEAADVDRDELFKEIEAKADAWPAFRDTCVSGLDGKKEEACPDDPDTPEDESQNMCEVDAPEEAGVKENFLAFADAAIEQQRVLKEFYTVSWCERQPCTFPLNDVAQLRVDLEAIYEAFEEFKDYDMSYNTSAPTGGTTNVPVNPAEDFQEISEKIKEVEEQFADPAGDGSRDVWRALRKLAEISLKLDDIVEDWEGHEEINCSGDTGDIADSY